MTTHNAMRPEPDRGRPGTLPAVVTSPAAPAPAAGRRAAAWLGWHVLELAGVGIPLVLAVTVDGWLTVLAVAAGAGWATHEIQLARRHRVLRPGPAQPGLTSDNTHQSETDREGPGR